jgi:hypothetical protein
MFLDVTVMESSKPTSGQEPRKALSLVLCNTRMLFFQAYPVFTRSTCEVFLTDALEYLRGAAAVCMTDNTDVVVASGTGTRMVPAPEMAAFAERFSLVFRADEKGDVWKTRASSEIANQSLTALACEPIQDR